VCLTILAKRGYRCKWLEVWMEGDSLARSPSGTANHRGHREHRGYDERHSEPGLRHCSANHTHARLLGANRAIPTVVAAAGWYAARCYGGGGETLTVLARVAPSQPAPRYDLTRLPFPKLERGPVPASAMAHPTEGEGKAIEAHAERGEYP